MLKLKYMEKESLKGNQMLLKNLLTGLEPEVNLNEMEKFLRYDTSGFNPYSIDGLTIDDSMLKKLHGEKVKYVYDNFGRVPTSQEKYLDIYDRYFNDKKIVKVKDILEMSEKLNFMVSTLNLVDIDKIFELENNSRQLKEEYANIPNVDKDKYYIICPLEFYDMYNHIVNFDNSELFLPNDLLQVKLMIDMMLPTQVTFLNKFKTVDSEIKGINNVLDDLKLNLRNTQDTVKNMSRNLQEVKLNLLDEIRTIRYMVEENVILKTEIDELIFNYQNSEDKMAFYSQNKERLNSIIRENPKLSQGLEQIRVEIKRLDPMIFKIDGQSLQTSQNAHVCMSWGKEFTSEELFKNGISTNKTYSDFDETIDDEFETKEFSKQIMENIIKINNEKLIVENYSDYKNLNKVTKFSKNIDEIENEDIKKLSEIIYKKEDFSSMGLILELKEGLNNVIS